MTTSLHFKTSAKNLAAAADRAGLSLNVYDLLNLTDHLITAQLNFDEFPVSKTLSLHESRVMSALGSQRAMEFMRMGQKINAIKVIREITGAGLKEAKDVSEDHRVLNATGYGSF